jgi:hypothetical protein
MQGDRASALDRQLHPVRLQQVVGGSRHSHHPPGQLRGGWLTLRVLDAPHRVTSVSR